MAVFPFTVRATDSEGSFADRQFNITVRNTRVERYLAISEINAWTSPDAQIWTLRTGMGGRTCAYGSQGWVIIGPGFIRKSADGVNWNYIDAASLVTIDGDTQSPVSFPTGTGIFVEAIRLKFYNGRYCFASQEGTRAYFYTSEDCVNWTRRQMPLGNTSTTIGNSYPQVNEDNGVLFINSIQSASGHTRYGWTSVDNGNTWSVISNITLSSTIHNSSCLSRINGLWFAIKSNAGQTSTLHQYHFSTDGSNWTQGSLTTGNGISPLYFTTYLPNETIYANGVLYVFTRKSGNTYIDKGQLYFTSTDGINWEAREFKTWTTSNSNTVNKYLYRNGVFLACSSISTGTDQTSSTTVPVTGMRMSTDGTTWQVVNEGITSILDIAAM